MNTTSDLYEIEIKGKTHFIEKNKLDIFLKNNNFHVDENGDIYEDKMGIIPEILSSWFDERTEMKKMVTKYGKERNKDGSINTHYDIGKLEYYNNRQKIQKVLLNSLYGVLGLPSFRYYDLDNAEAVTTTGVDLIKFAQTITNHYFNKSTKNKIRLELEDDTKLILDENSVVLVKRNEKNIEIKVKDILETDDFLEILHIYT